MTTPFTARTVPLLRGCAIVQPMMQMAISTGAAGNN
jgi:hypothetical protein